MGVGNDRFLFIHVPKTGGKWVRAALHAAGVSLSPESETNPHPMLSECDVRGRFTFGFVREPVSWYGSAYNYRRNENIANGFAYTDAPGDGTFVGDQLLHLDFPDFLKEMSRQQMGYLSAVYEYMLGPLEDTVDFVGRFENLADDLVTALQMAGQEFDERALRAFPPQNLSVPTPHCPPDVRAIVFKAERPAYERFYAHLLQPERADELVG